MRVQKTWVTLRIRETFPIRVICVLIYLATDVFWGRVEQVTVISANFDLTLIKNFLFHSEGFHCPVQLASASVVDYFGSTACISHVLGHLPKVRLVFNLSCQIQVIYMRHHSVFALELHRVIRLDVPVKHPVLLEHPCVEIVLQVWKLLQFVPFLNRLEVRNVGSTLLEHLLGQCFWRRAVLLRINASPEFINIH